MTPLTPDQRAARAVKFRQLFEDPDFKAAWDSVEADLVEEWKTAHTEGERENLWRAVQVVNRVETWLLSAASHDLQALRRTGVRTDYQR